MQDKRQDNPAVLNRESLCMFVDFDSENASNSNIGSTHNAQAAGKECLPPAPAWVTNKRCCQAMYWLDRCASFVGSSDSRSSSFHQRSIIIQVTILKVSDDHVGCSLAFSLPL